MSFHALIETVQSLDAPKEAALELLKRSREPALALELFAAASEARDAQLGRKLWWSAGISSMMPCKVEPLCTYCTSFTVKSFPIEDLVASVKAIESIGIRHLHLSGGTNLDGYDNEMSEMINAVRDASDMEIEVNLGPSFSRSGVQRFKQLGVRSITSSLETMNRDVFAKGKPGDSLERRMELIEICQDEGVSVRSMILVGLGESEADRIEHLYWLRQFNQLSHLRFSRFQPHAGTEWQNHPRCSPWEVARLVAVARLLLPNVDLGLAAGNSSDDIPLWYMAGGGNQLLGASVSMRKGRAKQPPGEEIIPVNERIAVVSRMKHIERFVRGLNREIGFAPSPAYEKTPNIDAACS
jgi:biotin synthase